MGNKILPLITFYLFQEIVDFRFFSWEITRAGADPAQNLTGSNHNPKKFDRCKAARKIF